MPHEREDLAVKLPARLYKYRKIDVNTVSLIVNSVIYFSKADQFNDPFNCRLRYNNEGTDAEWKTLLTRILQESHPRLPPERVASLVDAKIQEGLHHDQHFLDHLDDDAQRRQIERLCRSEAPPR